MFYFYKYLEYFFTAYIAFVSVIAISFSLDSLRDALPQKIGCHQKLGNCNNFLFRGDVELGEIITLVISAAISISWVMTKNWILNNTIGISLIMITLKIIKLNSLKVSCILLISLFFYDIFWVFYSDRIFDKSVMITVATMVDLPIKLEIPPFRVLPI